jgi:glycerate-2-kinase
MVTARHDAPQKEKDSAEETDPRSREASRAAIIRAGRRRLESGTILLPLPMTHPTTAPPAELLTELYWAGVRAARPGPALAAALAAGGRPAGRRVFIFALGKAAHPMARSAVEALREYGIDPEAGVVVGPTREPALHPNLRSVVGDHPEPGPGSLQAADTIGAVAAQVRPNDEVWVLLSGGATSLTAAPVDGVSPADLGQLYALLLGSGLDISAMNRIRKRFSRWGGGRLAAALAPARVRCFVVSDVIGDDLAAIGSGPCVPDPSTASEARERLTAAGVWSRLAAPLRERIEATERGQTPETPKPGDPAFGNMELRLIVSNQLALDAVAAQARALGLDAAIQGADLAGEAATAGAAIAEAALNYRRPEAPGQPALHKNAVLIWGGETTVTLGPEPGRGGRCQELALAAARVLAGAPSRRVTILAAGTDGRDGPTDAAGAIVDRMTWERIRRSGRDPTRDLASHDAYPALAAVGALLVTGHTGTNVMDVVIALVEGTG